MQTETAHVRVHPKTYRNHPITFFSLLLSIPLLYFIPVLPTALIVLPALGLGLWWLYCATTTLAVTDSMVRLETRLAGSAIEIAAGDIASVELRQGPLTRFFNAGRFILHSSSDSARVINISGIPDPHAIAARLHAVREAVQVSETA